jgi:ribonucleoside-diphosphate reductase alpha chain
MVTMDIPTTSTIDYFKGDLYIAYIFNSKYAMVKPDGTKETPAEAFYRVASYAASAELEEEDRVKKTEDWFWMMYNREFLPGGRIFYGAGREGKISLINCTSFILGIDRNGKEIDPDSIEAIYETAFLMAKVQSRGEGVGISIDPLRPRGAKTHNAAVTSTGAVSWMDLFSWTTGTIAQEGRRGAGLISINDRHPDIEEFITVKSDLNRIQYANISIKVSNEFMQVYENDEDWELRWPPENPIVTKTIKARTLMKKIAKNAYYYSEPGLLYWSHSQEQSNSDQVGYPVIGVNACETLDSHILTPDGYQTIEYLFNNVSEDNIFTVINGKNKPSIVKGPFLTKKMADVYEVTFSNGLTQKFTGNHIFFLKNNKQKELLDIDNTDILEDWYCKPVHNCNIEDQNEYERGIIAGWFIGDGSYVYKKELKTKKFYHYGTISFAIGNNESDYLDTLSDLIRKHLHPNISVKSHHQKPNTCTVIRITSKEACEKLLSWGVSKNKNIDPNQWSKSFKIGFLQGLVSSDGTVRDQESKSKLKSLEIYNYNRKMLENVLRMFHEFGIYGTLCKHNNPNWCNINNGQKSIRQTVWKVRTSDSNAKKIITPLVKFKQERMEKWTENNIYQDRYKKLRIVSVEYAGKEDVYCITEEETNSYICGGVCRVHNCSEEVLSNGSSCVLANINLSNLSNNLDKAYGEVSERAKEVLWFLDNIVTCQLRDDRCPTPVQKHDLEQLRRVGVGYTGLADFFLKMNVDYDSDEAREIAEKITQKMAEGAYWKSHFLSQRKGVYPAFCKDVYNSGYLKDKPDFHFQMRNVCCTTLPPVGSGSMILQSSSGVEPIVDTWYYRRTRVVPENYPYEWMWQLVVHPAIRDIVLEKTGVDTETLSSDIEKIELVDSIVDPSTVKTAHNIDWRKKIELMGAIQEWIDASISVTYNLSGETTSISDIEELYVEAWRHNLKGCTVYVEQESNRIGIFLFRKTPKDLDKEFQFNFSQEYIERNGSPYNIG